MSRTKRNHTSPESPGGAPAVPAGVVGIGASAGGLAALKRFFARIPADSGLAFVVVVHLSPEHESHLADLLQPFARMPVQQVTADMALEPDRAYIIPPGRNLDAIDTHLRLSPLEKKRGERAPIDHFFRQLADSQTERAVGVILTGSGSDGTLGIKQIKEKGGLTVVQEPNEAEYDSMPQSAIATGLVDLVLPLEQIPAEIQHYLHTRPRVAVSGEDGGLSEEQRLLLQKILAHVHARTGRDFSRYKHSTILRRIQRRMQLHHQEDLGRYLERLREQPEETQALSDEFLINVTSFFRDPEVFSVLEKELIPRLFAGKKSEDALRIWSVGCATGEEAYSIAMLLVEESGRHQSPPRLQVFASDLHEASLKGAREGIYSGDIEADVSPERLRRFFTKENGGYRVRKELRELVVFAPHNLLRDPPFSRLDLITCRNLMIYLQREVQQDVIEIFHYAVRPGGYLLLGTSETVDRADLFQLENKPCCLYRRRDTTPRETHLPVFPVPSLAKTAPPSTGRAAPGGEGTVSYGALHQRLLQRYAPPSLLVNQDYKVVHLSDDVGRYLVHPGGEPTASVFKLVREELRIELRAALLSAGKSSASVHSKPLVVRIEGRPRQVVLKVAPAGDPAQPGVFLIVFDEREDAPPEGEAGGGSAVVLELESELELTKQRLQAVIEEYETSQEEMKAANEELQSINEELQSTMEELETSKEELQSTNEELTTVNQENRHKVEELSQLSSDLQNLLAATDIATLFLDRDLRILRFTPQVSTLFNVRATDRGRPLSDLTHRLGYETLTSDALQVLRTLAPIDREVHDTEGRWYLTRVRPYRSVEDRIGGVVITFVEITSNKLTEAALRASEERFRTLADLVPDLLWSADPAGLRTWGNRRWMEYTGQTPEQARGLGWLETVHPEDRETVRAAYEEALRSDRPLHHEHRVRRHDGVYRWFLVRAEPLRDGQGQVQVWFGAATDVHEQRVALTTLEERVEARTREVRELALRLTMAEQEERRRISHILHDDLQQLLYGLQLKIRMIDDELQGLEQPALAATVGKAREWIRQAIDTTRQLTVDLSPPILKSEGLTAALEWLRRQMEHLHGLKVELQADGPVRLANEDLRVLLFQIVRELLFNCKKHAGTDRARVVLDDGGAELVLVVEDAGRGFEHAGPRPDQHNGFGLYSIRERLRLVGGRVDIHSVPGQGTRIEMHVPLAAEGGQARNPEGGATPP